MAEPELSKKKQRTLRTPEELVEAGLISADQAADVEKVSELLSIGVSPRMQEQIEPGRPDDPVARQFVPSARELITTPEETPDPIGDIAYMPLKGITHRYPDRLLLIPTLACATYCRFCFRREKVGPGIDYLTPAEMAAAMEYIRGHTDVREVIVTGGDPLILAPRRIAQIVSELSAMEHLDVIRFHTRIPVVAPELLTPEMMAALESDKIICVVVHANSAQEIGPAAREALKKLRKSGMMLVSHSVLLKGVNDTPEAMTALLRELVRNGVKPYYLHHCDLAEGVSHFRTTFEEGQALMRAIRGRLSGLAQPSYVLHIPGGAGKVPIAPTYIERKGEEWIVTDYLGKRHQYPSGREVE